MPRRHRYDVLPANGGWIVKTDDAGIVSVHDTKAAALKNARTRAETEGGALRVHDRAGQVRSSFTIGRASFEKISEVEGIRPTAEASLRSSEFERKGLSPVQRRRAIVKAFAGKR